MTAPPRKGSRSTSDDDPQDPSSGTSRGQGTPGDAGAAAEDAGFFPDLLRRGLTMGFTGLFMTEEAVRRALGDSVPRDVVEFFLEQSERTRAEFVDRLGREFGRVLNALDPVEIARRLLDGRTVEVTARVRLVPESERRGRKASAEPTDEESD